MPNCWLLQADRFHSNGFAKQVLHLNRCYVAQKIKILRIPSISICCEGAVSWKQSFSKCWISFCLMFSVWHRVMGILIPGVFVRLWIHRDLMAHICIIYHTGVTWKVKCMFLSFRCDANLTLNVTMDLVRYHGNFELCNTVICPAKSTYNLYVCLNL